MIEQNIIKSKRFSENPLIRPQDIEPSSTTMRIECLLNPGVFTFENKTWLLIRVAERPEQKHGFVNLPIYNSKGGIEILEFDKSDPKLDVSDARIIRYDDQEYLTTLSHLRLMRSEDGRHFSEPTGYLPLFGKDALEAFGIEDCRVTEIEGTYHLTYTMVSAVGVGVGLIQTTDWKNFTRRGMILPPHNKDCAIFTEKINNKYYALHRPSSPSLGGNYIWITESLDLLHWGNHKCLITTRYGWWDSARVGGGASPIRTDVGWLAIYHGADANHRYCLGGLLLDIHDPSIVLARSEQPLLVPSEDYELKGFFGNVVFTNGHVVKGDSLQVYYGASDEVICGAEFSIQEILHSLSPIQR